MNLRKIALSESEPIPLDLIKSHCEIDYDDKDGLLTAFRDSAIALVEKRAGIVLRRQDYRMELGCWPRASIEIPVSPVREVSAINYFDAAGVEHTVLSFDYRWIVERGRARLWFVPEFVRPALQEGRPDAVRIEFQAGYDDPTETGSGDDPELAFPAQARNIVLLLVSCWFNNRDAVVVGSGNEPRMLPMGVESLLSDLKVYR